MRSSPNAAGSDQKTLVTARCAARSARRGVGAFVGVYHGRFQVCALQAQGGYTRLECDVGGFFDIHQLRANESRRALNQGDYWGRVGALGGAESQLGAGAYPIRLPSGNCICEMTPAAVRTRSPLCTRSPFLAVRARPLASTICALLRKQQGGGGRGGRTHAGAQHGEGSN